MRSLDVAGVLCIKRKINAVAYFYKILFLDVSRRRSQIQVCAELQVKHATGQLENTAMLKTLRRDVARIESVLGEKREAAK